ncbi:hypothetical protein [Microbacterium sp. K41]|uniref:hypothetical protein n=1 Tax=Microbacterium sp. K41 TaxID=2305437 RepID=UPI00109CC123|nr:hypothetical protein [Microbacterium sp. K41]
MAGKIPLGKPEFASDITTSALIDQAGSRTQVALDGRLTTVAVDVIVNNPEVVDNAKAGAAAAAQDVEGLARVEQGKNLFDPSKRQIGYTLRNVDGSAVALAGYSVSDYIPVVAGQQVTVSSARNIAMYNASKGYRGIGEYIDNSSHGVVTVTPVVDGFLRASVSDSRLATFQVEKGAASTAYEPYARYLDPAITVQATAAGPLLASRTGDAVNVTTGTLSTSLNLTAADGKNQVLNFLSTTSGGTAFHTIPDSVAPIRTQQGTIGANHGFAFVGRWASHDKTTADLGSVWTDGTREYVILKVDGTGVWIGGSVSFAGDGSASSANVAPAAALTHVSGATNTSTIPSSGYSLQQLYPAIANRVVSGTLDAAPIANGRGREIVLRESYEILDYASLYALAKANIGVPYTALPVAAAVRVESEWRIRNGLKMIGYVALTEVSPTRLGQTGFFQAEAMSTPAQQTRWLPGVKAIGGRDYSAGVAHSALTVSDTVTAADLYNPNVPPTVLLDWRQDLGVGFAMAYDPWTGASANTARLANASSKLWDLRNTRKIYPNAIVDLAPGWGRVEARGYRAYLTATERDQILARPTDALAAVATLRTIVG